MRPKVTKAAEQGRAAAWPGATEDDANELNPYDKGTVQRTAWKVGFMDVAGAGQVTTLQELADSVQGNVDRLHEIARKCGTNPGDLSLSERMALLAIGLNIRLTLDEIASPILGSMVERSHEFDTINQMIADIQGRH